MTQDKWHHSGDAHLITFTTAYTLGFLNSLFRLGYFPVFKRSGNVPDATEIQYYIHVLIMPHGEKDDNRSSVVALRCKRTYWRTTLISKDVGGTRLWHIFEFAVAYCLRQPWSFCSVSLLLTCTLAHQVMSYKYWLWSQQKLFLVANTTTFWFNCWHMTA